ncbi:hypothetical protein ODJ79_12015 [Actinoplanes sp. KI2]|uniref:protealysin inhibitor emfourin n=1 Tax=Actinoplanes sp. KI2 TaxID=2983315 RepID=UPI0021D5EC73|nr:protealysin inhibitor emfourin [Actinoplanes sp. KI2]MCU7724443.1 hypothetical protein [Actinoplanes sp. KI2]
MATLVALGVITAFAPAAPVAAAPILANTIVLDRSGGFAGGQVTFVVDRSTVGGEEPRRMAGSPEFQRLRSSYQPDNACCDRFSYRLTVSYVGGYRKTVSTVQGTTAPQILWDVISAVERVGTRTSSR